MAKTDATTTTAGVPALNAEELRATLRGELIDPDGGAYEEARKVYNGMTPREGEVGQDGEDRCDHHHRRGTGAERGGTAVSATHLTLPPSRPGLRAGADGS